MKISDHLAPADVVLDATARNKRELLGTLAADAAGRIGRSEQDILDALQSREKLGSTALGRGVALPHAQLPGDVPPVMLFARLRQPIDFDARDGEPVDLVFLVLWSAADSKGLLEAMAEICRALRIPELLRRLRLAASAEDVTRLLRQHEESNPSRADPDPEER